MPTGYTNMLMKRNYDVKKWLLNDLIRGMGVCIMLRDEGDLTCNEIRAKLVEHVDRAEKRHTEQMEAIERHRQFSHMSNTAWNTSFVAESARIKKENEKRRDEHNNGKKQHSLALATIESMSDKASNEVTLGILKFAKEQLGSGLDFDYSRCYQEREYDCVEVYRDAKIKDAAAEVQYKGDSIEKDRKLSIDRLKMFDAFVDEIDKLLPGEIEKAMAKPIKKAKKK